MLPAACPHPQVHGAGTGLQRHPLFFLGFKARTEAAPRRRRFAWRFGRRKRHGQLTRAAHVGAAAAAAAVAAVETPVTAVAGAGDSWLSSYYGGAEAAPMRSPQLPARPEGLPALVSPSSLPVVPRKGTSLKLAVVDPASDGALGDGAGGVPSGGEEGEGADVAAERARAEALWHQW